MCFAVYLVTVQTVQVSNCFVLGSGSGVKVLKWPTVEQKRPHIYSPVQKNGYTFFFKGFQMVNYSYRPL